MNPLKQKTGMILTIAAAVLIYPALTIIWLSYGAKLALCLIVILLGVVLQAVSNKIRD